MKRAFAIPSLILIVIIVGFLGYFGPSFFSHLENPSNTTTDSILSTTTTENAALETIVTIPRVYTNILYNPTWQSPTQSGMYYKLNADNQRELFILDKQFLQRLQACGIDKPIRTKCEGFPDNTRYIYDDVYQFQWPSVITPQIEKLVISFFKDPILLTSSQSCAKYFWENDRDGKIYYPNEDMGEPSGWWNPYIIDINEFMKINPESGKKEIQLDILWTLDTQIQQVFQNPDNGTHYPNVKLIECLKKNKLLIPLQKHVGYHYEKIETALHGN